MSNKRELRDARRRAYEAVSSLEAIEALPRRRGSWVEWSNGVIWVREGDDRWRATSSTGHQSEDVYPSAHVADVGLIVRRHGQ